MTQQQVEMKKKKELEQSLVQIQNPLKSIKEMERDLELNQNFFLDNNVDHEQNIIPKKKTIKKRSNKIYSPSKVKSKNFLTNIS